MESYLETFNDIALTAAEKSRRDDAHDIGIEMAGLNTGRRSRFGVRDDADGSNGTNGKGKKKSALQTMLDLMLLDPEYAQAHFTAAKALTDAQDYTQSALARVLAELSAEQAIMDDILDRAARLPDGSPVFKDANGSVRNEGGEIVDATLVQTIIWSGDEPSYEAYGASKGRVSDLNTAASDLRGIQTELEDIDVELNDPDAPPSKERIDDLTGRIGELQIKAGNNLEIAVPPEVFPETDELTVSEFSASPKLPIQ